VDLALIGNGRYQALIDSDARVRWLCWPRFDSSFVFGGLLDDARGGSFGVHPASPSSTSEQAYLPRTNVLRTTFHASDGSFEVLDVAPRFDDGGKVVSSNALLRVVRPLSGAPRMRVHCQPSTNGRGLPAPKHGEAGLSWQLGAVDLVLETDAPLDRVVTGGYFLLDQPFYFLLREGEPIEGTPTQLLERTVRHWERWCDAMQLPGVFDEAVTRSALTLALHQYEPTGAITAATTTSIPEYPGSGRTWDYRYCWLRDAYFTLLALERLGHHRPTEQFVEFLGRIADASPDGLQPLFGIGGEQRIEEQVLSRLAGYRGDGPVRIGNAAYQQEQHDVYGEAVGALELLSATSEVPLALLSRLLDDIERTIELPDAGLWEIRDQPKLHTFSLLMHWYGATAAARIANAAAAYAVESRAQRLATRARVLIEQRCWREPGYYADAATTDHADAALLMMINLGYLLPGDSRAHRHVDHLVAKLSIGDGLMSRYLHHDGIGETHATFTVCGFWLVEALAKLGRRDEAEARMRKLLSYANHVGLFSEDIDPKSGAQLGNFPQTYSHAGLVNAAFALAQAKAPNTAVPVG
jgi:GH15 family glucan-1,4-alpha-glucosidase